MPPTPRRKPPSCIEILDQLGDQASWEDFLAKVAASSESDAGGAPPAESPRGGTAPEVPDELGNADLGSRGSAIRRRR